MLSSHLLLACPIELLLVKNGDCPVDKDVRRHKTQLAERKEGRTERTKLNIFNGI
jgi:hypothetical protein